VDTPGTAVTLPHASPDAVRFGMGAAADNVSRMMPARLDAVPPPGFPNLSTIRMLPAEIAAILASDERDKERFADLFGR